MNIIVFLFLREGKLDVLSLYLHRFARLTPLFGASILISTTILRFFGSGPFWPTMLHFFHGQCKRYWWSALLYIQNFVNQNEIVIIFRCLVRTKHFSSKLNSSSFSIQCFRHSWYLSLDMQLFIIAPAIVYLMYRFKTKAVYGLSVSIVGCMACTVAVHLKYNLTTMYTICISD